MSLIYPPFLFRLNKYCNFLQCTVIYSNIYIYIYIYIYTYIYNYIYIYIDLYVSPVRVLYGKYSMRGGVLKPHTALGSTPRAIFPIQHSHQCFNVFIVWYCYWHRWRRLLDLGSGKGYLCPIVGQKDLLCFQSVN